MAADSLPAMFTPGGPPGPGRPSSYTKEDVDRALTAIALYGGSSRRAARYLNDNGHPIPRETIDRWARISHTARYDEIRNHQAPLIAERIASEAEAVALRASRIEHMIIDRIEEQLPNIPAEKLPETLRNITTTKSLNVDKVASPLRGRPSRITEVRDVSDILRSLENKLPKPAVDSTAEDITDTGVSGLRPVSSPDATV